MRPVVANHRLSSVLFCFCERSVEVRSIIIFFRRGRMAAPLAFDFRTQFEHVRKSIDVEASIFFVSTGARHSENVGLGGDVGREMRFLYEQRDDLIAVTGIHQPALSFDQRGEIGYEGIAML